MSDKTAILYRMALPDHVCPFGLKAKRILQEAGYSIEEHILRSRDEVDAFEEMHGVDTTPQVFIDGRRLGGSDDLERFWSLPESVSHAAPPSSGLSPIAALAAVAAIMSAGTVVARRNSSSPLHPRIRHWYRRLDKPGFTPLDPVFGAVWPVLDSGLAFGGYGLLREPSSVSRSTALGL